MNICVVGAGYVGLVTGAVFADLGNEVVCVDNVVDKIDALRAGRLPIYEPGLEEMVARNMGDGRLSFTTDLAGAVRKSVIVFIAVGTPPKIDGQADLSAVEAVAQEIGRAMDRYTVVVNKSTVPVGTGEFVREVIERHQRQPVPFDVVSNPEFLREGSAIEDTLRPGSNRHRRPDAAGRHDAAGALRAARAPDDHHRRAVRGDDQVRLERLPGDQDLVHQRDRQHLRAGGRRRHPGHEGHGARRADRRRLPAGRPRLRRQLLSEGHRLARPHRRDARLPLRPAARRRRHQRRSAPRTSCR